MLFDTGWVPTDEPVVRLYHHGMVCDEKGDIMSKSKGNVVSPADIMDQWGVDVSRLAMFFFAPSNIDIKWKEDGLAGAHRLVLRLWNLFEELSPKVRGASGKGEAYKPLRQQAHVMLARMTQAAERALDFNTGIAEVYKLLNAFDEIKPDPKTDDEKAAMKEVLTILAGRWRRSRRFSARSFTRCSAGPEASSRRVGRSSMPWPRRPMRWRSRFR